MGGRKKKDDFSIDEAIEMYNKGLSFTKIAEVLETNYSRIRRRLLEGGVIPRQVITREDVDWDSVIKKYKNGYSLSKIAKELGSSVNFVSNAMKDKGINVRHWKEQVRLDCENGVNGHCCVDEKFFDEWSPQMAYVLGWIFTDGNIPQKENMFRITSTDIEHLRNIADLFTDNATITIRKWRKQEHANHKPAGTLSINRADMAKKLKKYGLKPAKSKDVKFPEVSKEYLGDFIRGVFEGDGHIGLKKPYKSPRINFTSGSYDFVLGLAKSIENAIGLKSSIHQCKRGVCSINYYSEEAMFKLFNLMYSGAPDNMILKRKYNRFLEYFTAKGVDIFGRKSNKTAQKATGRRGGRIEPQEDA